MSIEGPAGNLRKRKSNSTMSESNGHGNGHANGYSNGHANGNGVHHGENGKDKQANGNAHANGNGNGNGQTWITEHGRQIDKMIDDHHEYEFGGPVGVVAMMIGFPLLMYYLWACLWYYEGKLVYPSGMDDIQPFLARMGQHVYDGAYPTKFAWATYGGLTTIELLFAAFLPGLKQYGLPVPSLDYKPLPYECNALASWYSSLILAFTLHHYDIFRLPWIVEHIGELMSVAIISSFIITLVITTSGYLFHYGGKPLRMSNIWVYDYFMGVSLNPRLGSIDLKMFAEVRVPWVLLFMISLSGAVKQYEELGYVTYNMVHMLLATGLYINACAKGEHLIPQTWDMFHEKFGWMLIFWNMAGVPFSYCYPVIYMVRTSPSTYEFPFWAKALMLITLLVSYTIFDESMAQKSSFKISQHEEYVARWALPYFPRSEIKNPSYIQTKHGNKLLTSGWWAYARKINYTADWIQSCTWGLSAGLGTPITLFYPIFFLAVLTHRCGRDFDKCARKYGEDWERYCKVVKYRFIPGVY